MTTPQFTRFNKISYEPFFLLSSELDSDAQSIRFSISGSTQKHYVVRLGRDGRMRCNCMDAAVNCAKAGCVCKHVCFVAFRIARSERIGFFADKTLDEAEVGDVFTRVAADGLANDASRVVVDTASHAPPGPPAGREARNIGDDCPVCFDLLHDDHKENMRVCLVCANGVHEECMRRWIAHAPRPSCIFCRARLPRR